MVFNEQSGIDQGFYLLGCGDAVITVENGVGVGAPARAGEGFTWLQQNNQDQNDARRNKSSG